MNTIRKLTSKFRIGDVVRVTCIPEAVQQKDLPRETRSLFKRALGVTFVVQGFGRYGHIELDVSKIERQNTIWIEPDCLELYRRRPKRDVIK